MILLLLVCFGAHVCLYLSDCEVLQFQVSTCVCVCECVCVCVCLCVWLLLCASKTHSSQSSVARDASLEAENPRRLFLETTTEWQAWDASLLLSSIILSLDLSLLLFLSMGFNSWSCSHIIPYDVWPRAPPLCFCFRFFFNYFLCTSWTVAISLVRLTGLLSVHRFSSLLISVHQCLKCQTHDEHLFFWAILFPSLVFYWWDKSPPLPPNFMFE